MVLFCVILGVRRAGRSETLHNYKRIYSSSENKAEIDNSQIEIVPSPIGPA